MLDLSLLKKGVFKLQNQQKSNLKTSVKEIVKLMKTQAQLKQVDIKTVFKNLSGSVIFYFDQ